MSSESDPPVTGGRGPKTTGPADEPRAPAWRWAVPLALIATLWAAQTYYGRATQAPEITYTRFYELVHEGKVERVVLTGDEVQGRFAAPETVDGKPSTDFQTRLPSREDRDLLPLLRERKVEIVSKTQDQPIFVRILIELLPWVLIVGVWMWLSRRAQGAFGAGSLIGGITKGRTRRFSEETDVKVRFEDVAGMASAKRDLEEVVAFLREPKRFQRLGAHVPRGVLLVGPPGTGKTLLARAVAGEAGVPFFSINGSEFIELFVGVGAARVRELFETAKKLAPAIVFIDEIDAVGRARGTGLGGGHDEREQTLNQLLSEMDGFSRNDLTIVLAATNRPDVLDGALLRPGRFDRRVLIERPERAARRAILEVHAKGKPLGPDVKIDEIAAGTPGFSGADLANLVNEAALAATRRGADAVSAADFSEAQEKVLLGNRREGPLTASEKKRIAVHEAGHAIVAQVSPGADPVRQVSIIPRGLALGATSQLPGEDRHLATRTELTTKLRVLLGGLAAEQLVFGEPSTGAQNDLEQATAIAYDLVSHYGMSEAVGPVYYERGTTEHPFLGHRLAVDGAMSEATAHQLDVEVQRLRATALREAKAALDEQRAALDRLVAALLDRETVGADELGALVKSDAPRPRPSSGVAVA